MSGSIWVTLEDVPGPTAGTVEVADGTLKARVRFEDPFFAYVFRGLVSELSSKVERLEAEVRTVAERQREACAAACEQVLDEAERGQWSPGKVKTGVGAAFQAVEAVRATPLVTEEEP